MQLKEIKEIGWGAYGSIVLAEDFYKQKFYAIKKT